MKIKNFDTRLCGREYAVVLVRTRHFTLQAAGTFIWIDVQHFLHLRLHLGSANEKTKFHCDVFCNSWGSELASNNPSFHAKSQEKCPVNDSLRVGSAVIGDCTIMVRHIRVAQRAVLGFAAGYAFAPHAKRTGAQLTPHNTNDLVFGHTQSLENGFERGAILPSHLNHGGDITRRQVALER